MTTMRLRDGLCALALLLCAAAGAVRAESAFDGDWTAQYASGSGNEREAEVHIVGNQGTWKLRPRPLKDKKDPCVGRPFPMVLSGGSATAIDFRVEASATIGGCDDRKGSLKVVDAKTLEGQFSNGTPIKFMRP